MTTLHDGKILNSDNTFIWDNRGTGTGFIIILAQLVCFFFISHSNNKYNMSVTASNYFVRQTKRFNTYSSGKSQIVECTFDNFQIETNVTKRAGYFSSATASGYTASYDGFYLENDGTTFRLKADRLGTNTINVPWTSWDNYSLISSYDFSKFTVVAFDFLWLGGAVLRIFLKTDQGYVLGHTYNYSGTSTDTFIASPNQPIRYEIRASGGTGSFRYICSQVATEGSLDEAGYNISVQSISTSATPSNTAATIGTNYPLLAVRKKTTFRDVSVKVTGAQVMVSSINDILIWTLQLNPTLSSPLVPTKYELKEGDVCKSHVGDDNTIYTDVPNSSIQKADGSNLSALSITVTTPGRIISSGVLAQNTTVPSDLFEKDFLAYLGGDLNNTMDEIILCVQPITTGISLNGILNLKEY